MDKYKCLAVQKTTIKKCRNYKADHIFCSLHHKEETSTKQLYNGITLTIDEKSNEIKSVSNPIYLWKKFNYDINNEKSQIEKKQLEIQAKNIKSGTLNIIIRELLLYRQ